jgi:hypothetical protein
MRPFLIGFCFFVGSTLVCRADQPPCTGDRHEGCAATTTTTLPGDPPSDACPAGCISVTDIPSCPDVNCGGGDSTTNNVTVTVNRCPDVKFPRYAPCFQRPRGRARKTDVLFQGRAYKCPRPATPHRFFIPLP